jgi:hypothetical protein
MMVVSFSLAPSGAKQPATGWFLPSFFPYGKITNSSNNIEADIHGSVS